MLLKEVLKFYEPLKILCAKRLKNFKISRDLSKVLKKLEEESTFYSIEYKKLLDNYAKKDEKGNFVPHGNNSLEMKDTVSKQKFEEELKKLLETNVGEFKRISISEADFTEPNDFPTPQDMTALESIIDWDNSQLN